MLHDIGKPLVTKPKEINGEIKIVAPKHEEAGANYLAIRILELDLKQSSVQKILGLVGFHHIPKLLPIKNKDFGDYLNLSLNADLELLYWLELADMRGRICEDLDKQVDLLEQYRMFSEDYKLWAVKEPCENLLKKISFEGTASQKEYIDSYAIRQLAQNEITMIEEAPAKNYERSSHYGHLYLMCGISGSGKSTWIKNNLQGFEIISLDDIREEINGKEEIKKAKVKFYN